MLLPGIFVVGTDTGVGKTQVAAGIARVLANQGHRVGALKPIATGARREGESWVSDDADALLRAIGNPVPPRRVAPLLYEEPLTPSVAARRCGTPLLPEQVFEETRQALLWWSAQADLMVVEGIGGVLTPLAEGMTLLDLAERLDYPLLIVARRGLGTLNHTLLTLEAVRRRGLRVAGILLNQAEPIDGDGLAESTNADELARFVGATPILGELPFEGDEKRFAFALACMDWYDRLGRPRHTLLFGTSAQVKQGSGEPGE